MHGAFFDPSMLSANSDRKSEKNDNEGENFSG
jgi:hypothetical protein